MQFSVTKHRSLWWTISAVILIAGMIAMIISWTRPDIGAPLRPSLDFVGGTRLQLELDCTQPENCQGPIEPATVREILAAQGLANSNIQVLGTDKHGLLIRTKALSSDQRVQLQQALTENIGQFDPKTNQIDTVGPTLGRQIFAAGLLALIISLFGIIVYLSFRFRFDYALFALVALFHDVLLVMGVFSILGLVLGVEVDSLFIVALLTIIGYSVNDTVVIYDRVREVLKTHPGMKINQVVDDAVNQTLTRSINTTLTTLLSLIAIFLFGGETLKYFALALIIGFLTGAYSSIFIASTLLAWWRERTGQAILTPEMPVDATSD